ncbi:MAG: hypothetical protein K2O03_14785 [Lachnospiraceae bacterium]|nr:hypothetical protein [Lachnospiraceae bacterium]
MNKKLMEFLCEETDWEAVNNEELLHELPEFDAEVDAAVNEGRIVAFAKELSEHLGEMDIYKASLVSGFIGSVCEQEEDTSAGEDILKFFAGCCVRLCEMFQSSRVAEGYPQLGDERLLFDRNKNWVRSYYGFDILCNAVMSFLSRDAALRKRLLTIGILGEIKYLCDETAPSPYLGTISHIRVMQNTCGVRKLVVLWPEKKKGFYATANDLSNCSHLLFLLEEQMHKTFGEEYDMAEFCASDFMVRLSHGEYLDERWDDYYEPHFMECDYVTARHDVMEKDDIMSLIWGEAPPDDIRGVDDRGIIVLWRDGINRSFSPQNLVVFHEALRPFVEIERELTDEEYAEWIQKIREKINSTRRQRGY